MVLCACLISYSILHVELLEMSEEYGEVKSGTRAFSVLLLPHELVGDDGDNGLGLLLNSVEFQLNLVIFLYTFSSSVSAEVITT